ncbi:pectinesterase QRT1-like [Andrographis paniculata]|uniref:pectinesterase QRT1-like n=1 Tax=Andrographis paniculata TaxID=175694 RepID=UPI0021E94E45|nr:pectinesterase QRT1-like [Andrographis paniculata]
MLSFTILSSIQNSKSKAFASIDYITWDDLRIPNNNTRPVSPIQLDDPNNNVTTTTIIVVDQQGYGNSTTVQGAVDMVPQDNKARVKIHIRPGVYKEKILVPENKPYISFIGERGQASQTVITWHDKASDPNGLGGTLGTRDSASVTVLSDFFCARDIVFENSVVEPPGGVEGFQAIAFRISGEKAMFYKVKFLGSQDTLWDDFGSHYFLRCYIKGSVDFIFGNGRSLYRKCLIFVASNPYAIAAHHRDTADESTGFSFVRCIIRGSGPVYLGRAWGNYSRTIYSQTQFDLEVLPEGWSDWGYPDRDSTAMFGEYNCRGRGADRSQRVRWSKALTFSEAQPYQTIEFIKGQQWLRL